MGKNMYQSRNGADQPQERRNAYNHFKNDQTFFEPHHLVPRTCLNYFHVFRTRPAQILQRDTSDARPRWMVMMHNSRYPVWLFPGRETLSLLFNQGWGDGFISQGHPAKT